MGRPPRLRISTSTLFASLAVLACAAAAWSCSTSPTGFGDDGAGDGGSSSQGGKHASDGGSKGSGGYGGGGGGGAGADDAGAGGGPGDPGGNDDGGVSTDDGGGVSPGDGGGATEAGACVIGSAGVLGLIPGATMDPGTACVSCHASTGSKKLNVGGTVYSKEDEADSCLGVASGVQVVITDAQGNDHTLSVNSSGNFYDMSPLGISTPYKAKVTSANGSIAMISAQTNGDCNACHTWAGAQGAAGRIVGP